MAKKTCAFCKKKIEAETAYVVHAGKHNTYYCDETCRAKAMERKKKREENKKRKMEAENGSM